jgi:hypothetical protein
MELILGYLKTYFDTILNNSLLRIVLEKKIEFDWNFLSSHQQSEVQFFCLKTGCCKM